MNLDRDWIPARRAGQPDMDNARALPEETQGALEGMERMRQVINDRNLELDRLQRENRTLRKNNREPRPADQTALREAREEIERLRTILRAYGARY